MIMLIYGFLPLLFLFIFCVKLINKLSRRSHNRSGLFNRHFRGDDAKYISPVMDNRRISSRNAEVRSLDSVLFRAARRNGGRLTLSDVVIETGMGLKQAARYMEELSDGRHVSIESDDSGTIWYVFPELPATEDADSSSLQ